MAKETKFYIIDEQGRKLLRNSSGVPVTDNAIARQEVAVRRAKGELPGYKRLDKIVLERVDLGNKR